MKRIGNIVPESGLSMDYMLALGPVSHYLERVEQMHDQGLPQRWLHLAERTLSMKPVLKYEQFFGSEEYGEVVTEANREVVKHLDELVGEINSLWEPEEACAKMRARDSPECAKMRAIYRKAEALVYGRKESS